MKLFSYVLALTLALSVLAVDSHPGNEGGAGGDGVIIDGKTYLLDLVENGLEEDAYIDTSMKNAPAFPEVRKRVAAALVKLKSDAVVDGVSEKLFEVGRLATPFAYLLLNAMEAYDWTLVAPALVPIDDDESPLDIGKDLPKVQLAIRKIYQVYINRELWKKLPLTHQVALIFHEVAYALAKPDLESRPTASGSQFYYRQMSTKARQLVGHIFYEDHYTPGVHIPYQKLTSLGTTLLGPDMNSAFMLDTVIYDLPYLDPRDIAYAPNFSLHLTDNSWGEARPVTWFGADWAKHCANDDIPWGRVYNNTRLTLAIYFDKLEMKRDSYLNRKGQRLYYLATSHETVNSPLPDWENVFDAQSCLNSYGTSIKSTVEMWNASKSIFRLPEND